MSTSIKRNRIEAVEYIRASNTSGTPIVPTGGSLVSRDQLLLHVQHAVDSPAQLPVDPASVFEWAVVRGGGLYRRPAYAADWTGPVDPTVDETVASGTVLWDGVDAFVLTDNGSPVQLAQRDGTTGVVTASGFSGGPADSALQLATSRTINGVPFDGSANITITVPNAEALTPGTYVNGLAYDGAAPITWDVNGSWASTAGTLVARDGAGLVQLPQITASSGMVITPTYQQTDGVLDVQGSTTTRGLTCTNGQAILNNVKLITGNSISTDAAQFINFASHVDILTGSYLRTHWLVGRGSELIAAPNGFGTDGGWFRVYGTQQITGDLHFTRAAGASNIYHNNASFQFQISTTGPYIDMWASSQGVRLGAGATSWTSRSDARLKRDVLTVGGDEALQSVLGMRAVWYNLLEDAPDCARRIGVIAQEMDTVLPEVVDKFDDFWGVRYAHITPALIGALQEQQRRIDALTTPVGGTVVLTAGVARIPLTAEAFPGMVARGCRADSGVHVTNRTSWDTVRGYVEADANGQLTVVIECQNTASTATVQWWIAL